MKSDKSKHATCIASIKRSTMKPYGHKWTRFYESNSDFENTYAQIPLILAENEIVICSTVIDAENFSILTTQKLVTKERGIETSESLLEATNGLHGDFKGYNNDSFTFGLIQLSNGLELKYFIETGKASMIMIYGVRTLININRWHKRKIENVTRI